MNKIYLRTLVLFLSCALFWKCDSDEDPGRTAGQDIAGEWWVQVLVDGELAADYSEIITSNTAANVNTEMLISDVVNPNAVQGNFWTYKVKALLDPTAKTFSADEVTSTALVGGDPYEIDVNILNGRIITDGGLSRTGVKTDSIYFEIQFSDDATPFGTTYVVQGHRRTGFTEDDF